MNPLRMEVKSAEVRSLKGTSKRTGRDYDLREQAGWVFVGKDYPIEVRFLLGKGQEPLAPGQYLVEAACFYVARGGSIACDLSKATRIEPSEARPAA